uniref:Casein kinase substrate phosphoprotein PP28 domain-containing protein n=1 Tax=Xiphophorus couchianus TaxID=32473 RepID=A0A3B5MD40_9TELE
RENRPSQRAWLSGMTGLTQKQSITFKNKKHKQEKLIIKKRKKSPRSLKRAGVEGLIEIENPNRVAQKSKKVTQIELDEPKQLSRREREEIEKQKAKERYMKMHLAGKTDQAKADLARLAIIRKQREEAAKKKEEEKKAKEAAVAAAAAARGVNSLSLK